MKVGSCTRWVTSGYKLSDTIDSPKRETALTLLLIANKSRVRSENYGEVTEKLERASNSGLQSHSSASVSINDGSRYSDDLLQN